MTRESWAQAVSDAQKKAMAKIHVGPGELDTYYGLGPVVTRVRYGCWASRPCAVVHIGEYTGQFIIDQPIHLLCDEHAVFDAQGQGNALSIAVPGVTLEGCTVRNAGRNLTEMNAAIFIMPGADGAIVRGNHVISPGFGIFTDSARDVRILDNRVQGDDSIRSQDRGNGIHLFRASGALVSGNEVSHSRDGIYIDNSNGNTLENNTLHDLRYGVHYMYSQNNKLLNNHTYRTRTGYALMQSRMLTVIGNRSVQDQGYGILMNNISYSTLAGNFISGVIAATTSGGGQIKGNEGKALFIYNSQFNTIESNHFELSTLGIHLTAGSEDNRISNNAFVDNQQQVKYVATRTQEWSVDGRGNYWSDYLGWGSQRGWPGRRALRAQRQRRPPAVDVSAGAAADEQPQHRGAALGAARLPGGQVAGGAG
ncbi:hypothetical protein SSTU70S_05373 [Stutzerimonas stutzeri]